MDTLVLDHPAVLAAQRTPTATLTEQTDLRDLVSHATTVPASAAVEEVYDLFASRSIEFIAVTHDGALAGMCSRREIGMLLGSRYGFSLFGRRPILNFLCHDTLRIMHGTSISRVLQTVFSRPEASFYDDVLLVDSKERLLGLISTHALVRLENRLLMENIHRLEQQGRLLNVKNEQMEADLRMARELQQALLPAEYPTFPPGSQRAASSIQFLHRYIPSGNVGGDFFHVIPLSNSAVGVFICDVMGHGVRSALITAMLRALVEELAPSASDPGEVMTLVNRELTKILRQTGAALFATALYTVIDSRSSTMRYSIAGHAFPIHVRRAHRTVDFVQPRSKPGPALGLFPDAAYNARDAEITPGDLLLLFTDGLFEVDGPDEEEFGATRLVESISRSSAGSTPEIVEAVFSDIDTFTAGRGFSDDVCLVAVDFRFPTF